jgi:glycosyltransferase involved in cell wall biosynthesis
MRILLVASRDPGGRRSGRRAVLATIVRCLGELGHEVEIAVCSRRPPQAREFRGARLHHVPTPGPARITFNVAVHASRGTRSLNECLYFSRAGVAALRRIAARTGCDAVVADMIRTAPLAEGVGLPMLLDLDDLLSARYARLAAANGAGRELLGYYDENLPAALSRTAAWIANRALRWEARTVGKRELALARRARVVALVSPVEAARLASLLGRPVLPLPMAVDVPTEPAPVADNAPAGIFVGGLDYYPNLEAVRWYADRVAPALRQRGGGAVRLDVAGHCPDRVRGTLARRGIGILGYVEDLASHLRRYRFFAAPIHSGTGIKTKVLEAMGAGLPVVGTAGAFEGTGAVDGEHCLVAEEPCDFADAILRLCDDPLLAQKLGSAGRALVTRSFSPEAVRERWRVALTALESSPQ